MDTLFDGLHGGGAIADLFSEQHFIECCLRFERELARVQAGLGVIPSAAAQEIERVAHVGNIDVPALKSRIGAVGLPIVGLVDQLVHRCSDDLGQYLHFGATTQDVMDCALALQMKQALALVDASLAAIIARLDALAQEHKATIQAGRTNQQHALPLTFGFKVAVWCSGVRRQRERLSDVVARAATGQLGGAVGTLASFGELGHETRRRLMQSLDLAEPDIAWHSMRDIPLEAVMFLAQLAATLGKIGRDLLMLSSTEVGEVSFSAQRGASSTMPQKNNPVAASSVVSLARMLFHTAPMMLDAALVENERSLDAWYIELHALPRCFGLMGAVLAQTQTMLAEVQVHPGRMQQNTALLGDGIVSETVQMELARHMGLNRAHALVSRAYAQSRAEGSSVMQVLRALPAETFDAPLPQAAADVNYHIAFGVREVDAMPASQPKSPGS
jgi:3-carboxy-cis,cis-muconate cycloisomerase